MSARVEAPDIAGEATQETCPAGPAAARSLPALLATHAASTPERPFLFYPDGLDMRWRPYRTVAAQAAGGSAALAGLGLAAGERVAFRWRVGPDAVAADLAIQGAGLTAVPVGPGTEPPETGRDETRANAAGAGCAAWLTLPGEPAPRDLPAVRLPEAAPAWSRSTRRRSPPAPWPAGGGSVLVRAAGEGAGTVDRAWRTESQEALLAAGRTLAGRVAACLEAVASVRSRRKDRREVALASFDLAEPDGRALLAWALESGAALVLEPDPRSLGGVAVWARPTLVAGPLRGLAALEQVARRLEQRRVTGWLRRLGRRRPRRSFGRLRTVVLLGPGRIGASALSYWLEREVGVVRAA